MGAVLFRNRRGDRLKILVWDRSGFWVLYKRLEKGIFSWPRSSVEGRMEIRTSELLLLLSGGDITRPRRTNWYDRLSENVEEGLARTFFAAEIVRE
jgi:transposase